MKLLGSFPCYNADEYTYLFYGNGEFRVAFSSFHDKGISLQSLTLFSNIEKFPKMYQKNSLSELDKLQDFAVVYHE